jgi:hypothetical protein
VLIEGKLVCPRSRRGAAAAEEIDAEHLVAPGVERLARTDHFAPPALLARPDICHGAARRNAAEGCDQRAVGVTRHAPGDAHALEPATEVQRQWLFKLQDALTHGRERHDRGGQACDVRVRRVAPEAALRQRRQ